MESLPKIGGDICIFCYKNTESFCTDNDLEDKIGTLNSRHLNRFLNVLERFSDCHDQTHSVEKVADYSWSKYVGCCKNCVGILNKFCADYHQLKISELQLHWKLEQLTDIMKLAGRVPMREQKLRRFFQSYYETANGNEYQEYLESFRGFRRKIIGRCTNRLDKSLPRILLERNIDANLLIPCHSSPGLSGTLPDIEIQESDIMDSDIDETSLLENDIINSTCNPPSLNDTTSVHTSENEIASTIFEDRQEPNQPSGNEVDCLSICIKTETTIEESKEAINTANETEENLLGESEQYGDDKIKIYVKVKRNDNVNENNDETISTSSGSVVSKVNSKGKPGKITTPSKPSPKNDCFKNDQNGTTENNKKFQCTKCNKTNFKTKETLRIHVKYCQVSPKHQCSQCGKAYKQRQRLTEHELTHQDRSTWKFQCRQCDRKFHQKYLLTQHIKASHSGRVTCNICGKTLINQTKLKLHVKAIHEEPTFLCSECGKSFSRTENLKEHLLTHNLESSKYICSKCGKKWPSKQKLKRHMASHDVKIKYRIRKPRKPRDNGLFPRKFKCSECGSAFKNLKGLNAHSVIHKDPSTWKYQCSICGKRCYLIGSLKSHMLSHTKNGTEDN